MGKIQIESIYLPTLNYKVKTKYKQEEKSLFSAQISQERS